MAPKRFNATLWIAQGCGIGRVPVAPGTFGSVLGVAWLALLLVPQNLWILLAGITGGFALSVYACGAAEKILQETDPGSVVLDEITAVPACALAWVGLEMYWTGRVPGPEVLFTRFNGLVAVGVFVGFRIFDIAKPWPVRGSQSLPGGWGITVDDFLAAVYVNLATVAIFGLRSLTA